MIKDLLLDEYGNKPYIDKTKLRILKSFDDSFTITNDYVVGFGFRSRNKEDLRIYSDNWYEYDTPCYSLFSTDRKDIEKYKEETDDDSAIISVMLSNLVAMEYRKWVLVNNVNDNYDFLVYISHKYNLYIDFDEFSNSEFWKVSAIRVKNRKKDSNMACIKLGGVILLFLTLFLTILYTTTIKPY